MRNLQVWGSLFFRDFCSAPSTIGLVDVSEKKLTDLPSASETGKSFSQSQRERLAGSPILLRVAPFFIFAALTSCQGLFGESSRYWFYLAKTLIGAWLVWTIRPWVGEMRWKISWEAIAVGVAVFAIWIGMDGHYPKLGSSGQAWNPHEFFGQGAGLSWLFVAVRVLGSTFVVPPVEEIFYRSFLYRYIANPNFQSVPLGEFKAGAILVTSVIFGFAHFEWLPAIICALAYQGLVIWKNRLGDAITAHAVTNFLLGLWVIWKEAWQFW